RLLMTSSLPRLCKSPPSPLLVGTIRARTRPTSRSLPEVPPLKNAPGASLRTSTTSVMSLAIVTSSRPRKRASLPVISPPMPLLPHRLLIRPPLRLLLLPSLLLLRLSLLLVPLLFHLQQRSPAWYALLPHQHPAGSMTQVAAHT